MSTDSTSANPRTPLVRNRSSRRPQHLRRRSSGFDQGLYSASAYKVIEAPLKRTPSQASLVNGATGVAERTILGAEQGADDKDALTSLKLLLLTICMAGVQFTCKLWARDHLRSFRIPSKMNSANPLSSVLMLRVGRVIVSSILWIKNL